MSQPTEGGDAPPSSPEATSDGTSGNVPPAGGGGGAMSRVMVSRPVNFRDIISLPKFVVCRVNRSLFESSVLQLAAG